MEMLIVAEGVDDLTEVIDQLIKNVKPSRIEPVLSKAAGVIAREARKKAPVGPTGNLKKAIVKKKLVRSWETSAAYIAAIDRKKAPHAWLVVHGTSGVRQVDPPHYTTLGGRRVLITQTGIMPPNRFFDDAIDAKQAQVLTTIEKAIEKLIEEAVR